MQYLKKEKNKFIYLPFLLIGIIIIYIEISLLHQFPFQTPDITFIFVILFSLYFDGYYMPAVSLIIGIILDSLIGKFTGQYGLLFFLSSFISTNLNHNIRKDSAFAPSLLCGGYFIFENIYSYVIFSIYLENFNYKLNTFIKNTSMSLFTNMIFSLVIIFVISRFIYKKQVI